MNYTNYRSILVLLLVIGLVTIVYGQEHNSSRDYTGSQVDYDVLRFLRNYSDELTKAEAINRDYRLQRVILQDQLRDLRSVNPVNEAKVLQIEAKIKTYKKQEKVASKNYKKLLAYEPNINAIPELTLAQQRKLMNKVESVYQKLPRVFPPEEVPLLSQHERPVVTVIPEQMEEKQGKKKNNATTRRNNKTTVIAPRNTKAYAKYDASKDVMINPPVADCQYAYKGVDEFLGQSKIELKSEPLFFHTEPSLRPYMKGKEYIECFGGLAYTQGGTLTLNLEFSIRSQNAVREFGGFQKGSVVSFKLINGTIIKLLGVASDQGRYDEVSGTTRFKNQYALQKSDEKNLMEYEIDKIRVVWVNGYEDYDVYAVDFMMKQISCLFNGEEN